MIGFSFCLCVYIGVMWKCEKQRTCNKKGTVEQERMSTVEMFGMIINSSAKKNSYFYFGWHSNASTNNKTTYTQVHQVLSNTVLAISKEFNSTTFPWMSLFMGIFFVPFALVRFLSLPLLPLHFSRCLPLHETRIVSRTHMISLQHCSSWIHSVHLSCQFRISFTLNIVYAHV